mmetsp:Transcript_107981/g.311228  ORF Transcript_107981/g.311228 Transcript_107981/m.311228 type:complete len:246 (+) Transcript_107981:2822-3559(+)
MFRFTRSLISRSRLETMLACWIFWRSSGVDSVATLPLERFRLAGWCPPPPAFASASPASMPKEREDMNGVFMRDLRFRELQLETVSASLKAPSSECSCSRPSNRGLEDTPAELSVLEDVSVPCDRAEWLRSSPAVVSSHSGMKLTPSLKRTHRSSDRLAQDVGMRPFTVRYSRSSMMPAATTLSPAAKLTAPTSRGKSSGCMKPVGMRRFTRAELVEELADCEGSSMSSWPSEKRTPPSSESARA